jgi:hypothetical protein
MAVATMVLSTAAMKMAIIAAARTSVRRDDVSAGAACRATVGSNEVGSRLTLSARAAAHCWDRNVPRTE